MFVETDNQKPKLSPMHKIKELQQNQTRVDQNELYKNDFFYASMHHLPQMIKSD